MKIEKITINNDVTNKIGISKIEIERLGSIVGLIGKNGSGKTRILSLIAEKISNINMTDIKSDIISNLPVKIEKNINEIKQFPHTIQYIDLKIEMLKLQHKINNDKSHDKDSASKMKNLENKLKSLTSQIVNVNTMPRIQNQNIQNDINQKMKPINSLAQQIYDIGSNYLRIIKYSDLQTLKEAISTNSNNIGFEELIEGISNEKIYNEMSSIYNSSLKYLKQLPHKLVHDKHKCTEEGDPEKAKQWVSYKRYLKLKELFKVFLNKELIWEKEEVSSELGPDGINVLMKGKWLIDDRLFNYAEFSNGEKTIFAYILLFFLLEQNKELKIKESIIIIDEPELHLHPDAEIDLIKSLKEYLNNQGQLWIATHSINILSHLEYEEIFLVKKNSIYHPSQQTPYNTLSELLNIDSKIERYSSFLSSISEWTYVNFMTQCFLNPEIIDEISENDKEFETFKEFINSIEGKIDLLDFGAGTGRFFKQINNNKDINQKINYSAFDINPNSVLKKVGVKRIYDDIKILSSNMFDIVLMCNVLHEIDKYELVDTLNNIISILKEDSYLIIIEDRFMPRGERVGNTGFLLFDNDELKLLFNTKKGISTVELHERITCSIIEVKKINKVNLKNLIKALEGLKKRSLNKIIELRNDYKNEGYSDVDYGRKSALFSQLHINSILTIDAIEDDNNINTHNIKLEQI